MKVKRITYSIIFCLATFFCQAQIHDRVNVSLIDVRLIKTQEFDQINWQSNYTLSKEGEPELPIYRVSYVLPIDVKLTGVTFLSQEKRLFKQGVYIYPAQAPRPVRYAEDIAFTQPDKRVYESDVPYPGKLYDIESDVIMYGYHVVTIRIYPFEYIPKNRVLNYYPNLEYTVEYESGGNPDVIRPKTQSVLRADLSKIFIKHFVKNAADVEKFGSTARSITDGRKRLQSGMSGLRSQNVSVLDGTIPEYIIITCDSLKQAFQPLVDWKTKKGIFTIVKTVEEINTDFSGNDLPEKIRKYLLDTHTKWGDNLFILLGGDINIVPSRMVAGSGNALYPADKYYSTSDNWTMNSNHVFTGSNSNSYFNFLGRIPVSNTQEVSVIISKIIAYEKADNLGNLSYLKNNLYADAYLSDRTTVPYLYNFFHTDIKSYVVNHVPIHINNKYICDNADCTGSTNRYDFYKSECNNGPFNQGNIEFNRNNFLSCLSTGANLVPGKFHFIYHIDHSGPDGMATSGKDKGQGIYRPDMDSLKNGTSWQILMSGGCKPANFQYNCMGKHYLMNSTGGGVTFIGNTDNGYGSDIPQLNKFLQSLYTMGRYDIANAFQKAALYNKNWRLHLLGDPEMQVWTNVPDTLQVSLSTQSLVTGENSLTVTIGNLLPGDTAMICLHKGEEVYEVEHNVSNGPHIFNFTPRTTGALDVTVTAHNRIPKEISIPVTAGQHSLYISGISITDDCPNFFGVGNGNGNGKAEAGETIALGIDLINSGLTTAPNVSATLHCDVPCVTIHTNTASFGTIAPETTAGSLSKFLFTVDKYLGNDTKAVFSLEMIDGNGITYSDYFTVDLLFSAIKTGVTRIVSISSGGTNINAGDTVQFLIDLINEGGADATNLKGILYNDSPSNITSCSSTPVYFPTIKKNETKTGIGTFQFTVSNTYNPSLPLSFVLYIANEFGMFWEPSFDLATDRLPPIPVDSISSNGYLTEIELLWKLVSGTTGVSGYNIYRSDVDTITGIPDGNYVKVNNSPVSFPYFRDRGLRPLTKYAYKISAVSESMNESDLSAPHITWTSYPQKYLFPVNMDNGASSSGDVQIEDIDNDGYMEIFATIRANGYGSCIAALRYDGTELFDIDNNITTHKGFAVFNNPDVEAGPSIGDLYAEGEYEMISLTNTLGMPNNLLSCYSFKDENPKDNRPDLLWELSNLPPSFRGAVLSNIDNSSDGSMEIVVKDRICGNIRVYDNKGNSFNTFGPSQQSCSYEYSALAVADLDGKGGKEIIAGYKGGIYIWHHDGKPFLNNNPLFFSQPGYRFDSSPVICDLNGCGKKEILIPARSLDNTKSAIFAIKLNGDTVPGWGKQTIPLYKSAITHEISVGELVPDSGLYVVCMGNGYIKVWNKQGKEQLSYFDNDIVSNSDYSTGHIVPLLADVDGDSECEIIFPGNGKRFHAIKLNGKKALGFPINTADDICGNVAVADVDGDGKNELIAAAGSKIYMWQTDGNPNRIEWGSWRHNPRNTGEYTNKCPKTIIRTNTTWNTNRVVCDNIIVESGTLTLSSACTLTMKDPAMIIVKAGANLVIDGGSVLDANIKAMPQSSVTMKNNAYIKLRNNGEFNILLGATFDLLYGEIDITPQ